MVRRSFFESSRSGYNTRINDVPSPPFCVVGSQIQEDDRIRRRKTHITCLTPRQLLIQTGFCRRECDTRVGISITNDGRPFVEQPLFQFGHGFPPVRTKQQMNGSIIQIILGLQILIDQVSHHGTTIGKVHGHGRQAEAHQVFHEQCDLSGFSTSINALKDNERPTTFVRRNRGWIDNHLLRIPLTVKLNY